MIEEAAILVVGDEHCRLRPLTWIRDQGGDHCGEGTLAEK